MLNRPGIPLYLQFKLSHCMIRANAQEYQQGSFAVPFYRMYLHPSKHSKQHEMLLDLENDGNEVYYSAPAFHELWELNEAYLNHQVRSRSIWIHPSSIGQLPDEERHHVAFQHPGQQYFCSKSRPIEEDIGFAGFTEHISSIVKEKGDIALSEEQLHKTADRLAEISLKRKGIPYAIYEETKEYMQTRKPIERLAFYSYLFLDAQMFIVNRL